VRLFAGLWATGMDESVDFNCISNQEKGFCPYPPPGVGSLTGYHDLLIQSARP
jgi:hypothetical protein